jgi:serine/threonine-protein kinase
MSKLNTLSRRPPPDQPTTDHHSDDAVAGLPEERARLVLVEDSGPQSPSEPQVMLQNRLRVIALILLGANTGATIIYLGDMIRNEKWLGIDFNLALFVAVGVYLALLWRQSPLSVRGLRAVELVMFGTLMLGYSIYICSDIRLKALPDYSKLDVGGGISALSAALALPGFAFMVIYGTYIPNTGRRCAVVVGVMALFPLLVVAVFSLITHQDYDLLFKFLGQMTLWMALGVAVAIYGSHRIEVLRQAVSEARKLGQYQLKQRLGEGGMGEVYLAEHILLRRPCAIKLIRQERAGDPTTLSRFEREVRATATLTHPNTIEIFDYGHADDGTFYYVMEYLPGLSLEALVEEYGPLPPERAVYLLRQVCGPLQEAHAIGLIHRDIKPSNILTCERGGLYDVAKLLDFGLVQAASLGKAGTKLTLEGSVTGTPAFMSPEQAAGREALDGRSDLYSLGAVAYYLLTGQPPFVRSTAMEVLASHIYEPAARLTEVRADVPPDLQEVVLRCLEKDPARRFPTAESLEQALAQCRCAGEWTRKQAADWWRNRAERRAAPPAGKVDGPFVPEGEQDVSR